MQHNPRIRIEAAPLRKQVVDLMRESIALLAYVPGQRLVEQELCEQFGVSRTVIREALRHLEGEGLIEMVANQGPIVYSPSVEDVRALYEVREEVEGFAAQLCAERATSDQKKELRRALSEVVGAYREDNARKRLSAKDELYRLMFEGTGNSILGDLIRGLHTRVQLFRSLSLRVRGRIEKSIEEHEALVAAIEKGDGEMAREAAKQHVRNAAATVMSALSESMIESDGATVEPAIDYRRLTEPLSSRVSRSTP